jgi:GNAT superfamily N-acetyltransferase
MNTLRGCGPEDTARILEIVNAAAVAYRGVVPAECLHDPYMPAEELRRDMEAGVSFLGCEVDGALMGVMGLQVVREVHLIRHAYVMPGAQGARIGALLIAELKRRSTRRLLVGTWAAAHWAIRFYERHGFGRVPSGQAAQLLSTYWNIPRDQAAMSVVLERAGNSP